MRAVLSAAAVPLVVTFTLLVPRSQAAAQTPTPATPTVAEHPWTLFATGSAVFQQYGDADLDGRSIGAELEWTPPAWWNAGAGYRYRTFTGGGGALHIANGGAGIRLPFELPAALRALGEPRLHVDALVTRGAELFAADDHYTNVTVPVSLGLGKTVRLGRASLSLLAAGQAIYSRTDARLFGFAEALQHQDIGAGAQIEATLRSGAFVARMNAHFSDLDADLGPQPLGDLAIELAIGVGL